MVEFGRLTLALSAAFTIAALAPILKFLLPVRLSRWLGWCSMPAILACTLIVPADRIGLRALTAFIVNEVALKVVEFFRHGDRISLRDYFWLLIPFPTLAIVYPDHKRRLLRPDSPWPHVATIVLGTLVASLGYLSLNWAQGVPVLRSNFALDHAFKVLLFIPTIESISRVLFALERLAGFDTTPVIRNAFLARTPAEFWQRYNSRVHDWLMMNVYQPTGGRRHPVRGVILVFLFSGVLHELMFGIATSRFDGCQLLFFLLQIPAVLASGRIERFARRGGLAGKMTAHGVTILFMAVTSVLFFRGMSRVFPNVYASGPWL